MSPRKSPPVGADSAAPSAPAKRKRLPSREREQMIIRGAIPFFASAGFSATTRDLADHLGITQSLLYQYFPTKDALIDRLYHELVLDKWKPEWERGLDDRGVPLADRLERFYLAYTEAIFSYDTMRIFFFMWLTGENPRERYLSQAHNRLFRKVCIELRQRHRLPDPDDRPVGPEEEEVAAALHGSIVYYGVRQFIFGVPPRVSRDLFIRRQVAVFLRGAGDEVAALLGLTLSQRQPGLAPTN